MKKLLSLTALTRLALLRKVNILFFSTVLLFQLNFAGSSCNEEAPDSDSFDEARTTTEKGEHFIFLHCKAFSTKFCRF